jgi:uncharacterized XkdX family phage protein
MNWYLTIKDYYDGGQYTIEQVKVFVVKNKITIQQFEEITGELYL